MTAATVAMELLRSVSDQYYPARHAFAGTREPADHGENRNTGGNDGSARPRSAASARIRRRTLIAGGCLAVDAACFICSDVPSVHPADSSPERASFASRAPSCQEPGVNAGS